MASRKEEKEQRRAERRERERQEAAAARVEEHQRAAIESTDVAPKDEDVDPPRMAVFRCQETTAWVNVAPDPATKKLVTVNGEYVFALPMEDGERVVEFDWAPVPMEPKSIPNSPTDPSKGTSLYRAYAYRVVFGREMDFDEFVEEFPPRKKGDEETIEVSDNNGTEKLVVPEKKIILPPGS